MSRAKLPDGALLPLSTLQTFLDKIDPCDTPSYRRSFHKAPALAEERWKKHAGAQLAPTNTREGHSQRLKLLHRQIHGLREQLKHLHKGHQREVDNKDWKRQAILERSLKSQSMDENKHLKKRLEDEASAAQTLRSLILKQNEAIRQIQAIKRLPSPSAFILLDEDTRTFAMIKASMDTRLFDTESSMHKRLRVITTQWSDDAASSSRRNWTVSNSSDGVLMSMEKSGLIPFEAEVINAAICEHVQIDRTKKLVDKISRNTVTKIAAGSSVDGTNEAYANFDVHFRSMLRRVRSESGCILMWESVSTWQNADIEGNPTRVMVRDHGWSTVAPAAGYAKDVSTSHCQMTCYIQSMDGMQLQQEDQLATSIIHYKEQTIASQSQLMENMLMDRKSA